MSRAVGHTPRQTWSFLAVALASATLVYLLSQLASALAVGPVLAFALAFACVSGEIVVLSLCAPAAGRVAALFMLPCASILALLFYFAPAAGPAAAALLTFALGIAAATLGGALGARIEQPGQLSAVALVSSIADMWSVFDAEAPSARLAEQALAEPEKLALFALPFPLLGTPWIAPVIGAGDIVFTALYCVAFRAHALALRRLTLALALAYGVALVALIAFERPLPLLPLLGAAAIASDRAARSLTRREWRTVGVVCVALLVAVALFRSR